MRIRTILAAAAAPAALAAVLLGTAGQASAAVKVPVAAPPRTSADFYDTSGGRRHRDPRQRQRLVLGQLVHLAARSPRGRTTWTRPGSREDPARRARTGHVRQPVGGRPWNGRPVQGLRNDTARLYTRLTAAGAVAATNSLHPAYIGPVVRKADSSRRRGRPATRSTRTRLQSRTTPRWTNAGGMTGSVPVRQGPTTSPWCRRLTSRSTPVAWARPYSARHDRQRHRDLSTARSRRICRLRRAGCSLTPPGMVPGPSVVRDQLARRVAGWRTLRASCPPRLASSQPEGPPASLAGLLRLPAA